MPTKQGSQQAGDCLNLFRLPGRLDARQTACLLGFQPHDIPVLITSKLLQPLGKPVPNAPKYFAACVLEELRVNPDWLDKASRTISRHWQMRNDRKGKTASTDLDGQTRSLALHG
jgi:hypothetical protein